jgi:hypothetical protein
MSERPTPDASKEGVTKRIEEHIEFRGRLMMLEQWRREQLERQHTLNLPVLDVLLVLNGLVLMHGLAPEPSYPLALRFLEQIGIDAPFVAAWVGIGTLMQAVGAVVALVFHKRSDPLRAVGLAMTGAVWMLLGTTVMVSNPNTMFGFSAISTGILSWWYMLRLS